jgi:hypothetical protein
MGSEFINCPNCGTRNFRSDVYCGICKTLLTSNSSEETYIKSTTKKASYKTARKNHEPTKQEQTIGGIVLFIIIAVVIGVCNSGDDKTKDSSPKEISLNASVRFTGTQFVITNNDNFDYANVDLTVNSRYFLRAGDIPAHQTYTVGMMQFANLDGKRFSFDDKPQFFDIWCQISDKVVGKYKAMFN